MRWVRTRALTHVRTELRLPIEVLATIAAASALVLAVTHGGVFDVSTDGPVEWFALGLILLSLYLTCRCVRLFISRDRLRMATLIRQVHVTAASAVANTIQDRIGNQLAVTAGYSELLLHDPRLPLDIHVQAERIFNSSMAAAETIQAAVRDSRPALEPAADPDPA